MLPLCCTNCIFKMISKKKKKDKNKHITKYFNATSWGFVLSGVQIKLLFIIFSLTVCVFFLICLACVLEPMG